MSNAVDAANVAAMSCGAADPGRKRVRLAGRSRGGAAADWGKGEARPIPGTYRSCTATSQPSHGVASHPVQRTSSEAVTSHCGPPATRWSLAHRRQLAKWLPPSARCENTVRSGVDQSLGTVTEAHLVRRLAPISPHFQDLGDTVTLIKETAVEVQLIADVGLHVLDHLSLQALFPSPHGGVNTGPLSPTLSSQGPLRLTAHAPAFRGLGEAFSPSGRTGSGATHPRRRPRSCRPASPPCCSVLRNTVSNTNNSAAPIPTPPRLSRNGTKAADATDMQTAHPEKRRAVTIEPCSYLTFAKLLILKQGCGVDLRVRCRDWPD
jgi:hypothetical protein